MPRSATKRTRKAATKAPPEGKRYIPVTIHLTPAQHAKAKALADADDRSMANWFRKLLDAQPGRK